MHLYKYKRTQLKHCYDDRAKILLHRTPVLTSNTINFVVKNNSMTILNNESNNRKQKVTLRFAHEFKKSYETLVPLVSSWLPGHWGRTRHLSLNQPLVGRLGTGTAARGNPGTRSPRVVGSENPRTSPSGSRTAIPYSGLARLSAQSVEPPGKVHLPPGGTLVSPAGSHNLVGAVSIGQAMLVANWPFFGNIRRGDRPPCPA